MNGLGKPIFYALRNVKITLHEMWISHLLKCENHTVIRLIIIRLSIVRLIYLIRDDAIRNQPESQGLKDLFSWARASL